MSIEKLAQSLNDGFKSKKDPRVSKPNIWICAENPKKYLVWPSNWVLEADKVSVMMDKPNDISLYSNIASKQLEEARQFYTKQIYPSGKNYPLRTVRDEEQKIFFDYFEKIVTAVILSYTALEALANIFIPDDFEVRKEEKKTGLVKIWNKKAIEQIYTLRDKFKLVLKEVLNTPDPSTEKWWSPFIELEDLRNEIIHSKNSKSEERYAALLSEKIFDLIENHKVIIGYYGGFLGTIDKNEVNLFPYNFGRDEIKNSLIEEKEFDKTWKELTNS